MQLFKILQKKISFLLKEKYLFLFVIIFTLIPIVVFPFFPTMDGPTHLYNSNLLNEIILDSNNFLSKFLLVNDKPVPNLSGHALLSFFNLFLPAFLAEKALLIFYVVGLCYSYKYLIKAINPEGVLVSYLIFPFVYSFVFILGFYNFSIALVFLFITLTFWIKNEKKSVDKKQIFILFLLLSITFFSHIFVFAVLLLSLGTLYIFRLGYNISKLSVPIKTTLRNSLQKLSLLCLSAIIPFTLFIHYFYSRPPANDIKHLSLQELTYNLFSFRSILSYNEYEERQYIDKIAYVFIVFCILVIVKRTKKIYFNFRIKKNKLSIFKHQDLWLFIGGILILMYYTLSDSNSYGGYITTRISLIFYLVIILWVSAHKLPKTISLLLLGVVFYSHFHLVKYYTKVIKNLNELAIDCKNASDEIASNSVVLPLNYSKDWLVIHFSNYLGIEKPMVILDNYEAVNDYFPLKWNWNYLTTQNYDNIAKNNFLCMDSSAFFNQKNYTIDYIFVLGDINSKKDDCSNQKKKELLKLTKLVFENKSCKIYKFIKN